MRKLVIIDYGSGNLRSAAKACERALLDFDITGSVSVSANAADLKTASHILLPGVGAFGDCIQGLRSAPGMLDTLTEQVLEQEKWFLGICVGMQLLFDKGLEHGEHEGLGWIGGEVDTIMPKAGLKIPHMGWNSLAIHNPESAVTPPLFRGIENGAYAYFVHSYQAQHVTEECIIATTDYGGSIVASVAKDNLFGTQFHPEKSQETGLRLLANFLKI